MFRWILALGIVGLLAVMLILPRHAKKTSYVNGLPPYTDLPGKDYILERDCYIFKTKEGPTDWPLIASDLTVAGLPAEVDPKFIGADLPKFRILDVLRVGDRFKIASVRRDEQDGKVSLTFEVLLADEATRKFPRVDAYWIMDHRPEAGGGAPQILTAYAVPRFAH
jgi:hypothetical protein